MCLRQRASHGRSPRLFTPKDGFYEFEGDVTFAKMCSDLGVPISVASPEGFAEGGMLSLEGVAA